MTVVIPALAAWSWKVGMRGDDSGGELNSFNAATHKMRIRQNPVAALVFENLNEAPFHGL